MKTLVGWLVVISLGATAYSQPRTPSPAVLYEGGRLIIGDGSAPIEGGAFVVRNGQITAIGHQGASRVHSRGSDWQDGDAGDDQRTRPHRLRGIYQLGRRKLHGTERSRPSA